MSTTKTNVPVSTKTTKKVPVSKKVASKKAPVTPKAVAKKVATKAVAKKVATKTVAKTVAKKVVPKKASPKTAKKAKTFVKVIYTVKYVDEKGKKVTKRMFINEEGVEEEEPKRSFKVKLNADTPAYGRFSGVSPYQAANKALSGINKAKTDAGEDPTEEITFYLIESTLKSKKRVHQYHGRRIELDKPVKYIVNGTPIIKYYKNALKKIKKNEQIPLAPKVTKKSVKAANDKAAKKTVAKKAAPKSVAKTVAKKVAPKSVAKKVVAKKVAPKTVEKKAAPKTVAKKVASKKVAKKTVPVTDEDEEDEEEWDEEEE